MYFSAVDTLFQKIREIELQHILCFFVKSILANEKWLFCDFFREINFFTNFCFFPNFFREFNCLQECTCIRFLLIKSQFWDFFEKFRKNSDHEHSARFFETKKKDESSVKPSAYSKVPSEFCCTIHKKHFWVLICILFYTKWRNCYTIMQCENYEDLPSSIFYVKSSRNSL